MAARKLVLGKVGLTVIVVLGLLSLTAVSATRSVSTKQASPPPSSAVAKGESGGMKANEVEGESPAGSPEGSKKVNEIASMDEVADDAAEPAPEQMQPDFKGKKDTAKYP
ncbi:unnamed protein product [Calypogeia fissa]